MCSRNNRKRKKREEVFELIMAENSPRSESDTKTDSGSSENTQKDKQEKTKKNKKKPYTQVYHIQTIENKRQ